MATWKPGDAVDEGLRALRPHDVPDERAERVRARCVAALAARRPRPAPGEEATTAGWRAWLEPVFALGLGALYLAEAVVRALAVYR